MKKQLLLLSMLLVLLIYQPCIADGYLLGDMNGDGKISIEDIVCMIERVKENNTTNTFSGDINKDGIISLADINLLSDLMIRKNQPVADTLRLQFIGTDVVYSNPYPTDMVSVSVTSGSSDVFISNKGYTDLVISVCGESSNGRIVVDSNTEYTLKLNSISLTSTHAPAFNSIAGEKVKIEIADNTTNSFCDAKKYTLTEGETASGCFNGMGQMTIFGNGTLNVQGKSKHAIYCKKSITVNSGTINVDKAASDAVHSGKHVNINGGTLTLKSMDGDAFDLDDNFTMTDGTLNLDITGEAAKGIKCCGIMDISGGIITATATGALKNKNGNLSYCTILKCDSCMTISGGTFTLSNSSPGGKCISVGRNAIITGGRLDLKTTGDGAEYTNAEGETNYYTSKCIAADDSLLIHRGNIQCLSTGIGGKGIVGGKYMEIGKQTDTAIEQGPTINIETTNSSIVNDVEEDLRYGCPKAIKANEYLNIYSGDIHCTTAGMGGEGIECGKEMYVYNGNLECNCFDDGINVGEKLEILGGYIYCCSEDNDGIDSNGSIYIKNGIIAAVNKQKPNESLDSESYQLYISGGIVFGIGAAPAKIGKGFCPYYNTLYTTDSSLPPERGLRLTPGKCVHIIDSRGKIVMSLQNPIKETRTFLTIVLPDFQQGDELIIGETETLPLNSSLQLFDGKMSIGGDVSNYTSVRDVTLKQDE